MIQIGALARAHRLGAVLLGMLALAACKGSDPDAPDASPGDSAPITDGGLDGPLACLPPVVPDAAPLTNAATCAVANVPGSCIDSSLCTGSRSPHAGACAGGATIQCCTPRYAAAVTCDPNRHAQPNACLDEEPGDLGCMPGMVRVDEYCVDRFEGSLVEGAGVDAQPWSPYFPPTGHAVRAVSLRGAVPQGYISEVQAASACAASGKRLCSNAEWLRACRGAQGTTYPYGATREPGVCNDARATHPAVELYGTSDSWIFSHLDSPCLNQEAAGLALTGARAGCVTSEGAFDMMGNLHEWTSDPAGTFRGGFYVDTKLNGDGCLYATTAHATAYSDYSTGFRCCADATPSQ